MLGAIQNYKRISSVNLCKAMHSTTKDQLTAKNIIYLTNHIKHTHFKHV